MKKKKKRYKYKANEIPCQEISDPIVLSKNPLVSVKMITYNHEPYIAQAIEGVLEQKTNFSIELLVGEDCSTDKTLEIVLDYQTKYPDTIRVIVSDKNVGAHKNGIRTMKACRGKYIAYCEGDDFWHNTKKLQKQVDYLESHPECGLVSADCNIYYKSNIFKRSFNYNNGFQSPMNLTIEQILEQRLPIWTCTVMVRRDLQDQIIKGDPYLHQSENFLMGDTQRWAELALISVVTYIPECLAVYRILDESASKTKDAIKTLRFTKSIAEMKMYLFDKHKLSGNIRRMEESSWCDATLRLAFRTRNANLADEVRSKKKRFNWKEWLRYYGAKHLALYYVYRVASVFLGLFRKQHERGL